jgi:hypothetical protein
MGDAAQAAAGVYADVAQIPVVGWLLAPPAAAAAFAAVAAYDAMIPSAERGMAVTDEGLMMAHENEMVLPAELASRVRGMTEPQGGGGSGGDHFHVHPSAIDTRGMDDFFKNNGHKIAKSLLSQVRNGNPGARAAVRSAMGKR